MDDDYESSLRTYSEIMANLGIIADEPINQRSSSNPPSLEKLKEDGTITDFDIDYKTSLGLE